MDLENHEFGASLSFGQGFYKRLKLLDARKFSSVLSRDAEMRRLMQIQAENSYMKLDEFVINRLREIMRSNRFAFFIPKAPSVFDHYLDESS
jgi:[histone H3]-lysine4 N-trimethyltransferase ATXR3